MPAGIPKRLTDQLATLGYVIETYHVLRPSSVDDDTGEPLPRFCGIEVRYHGRVVGVAEHEPRGWGGDNKWYVFQKRTLDGWAHPKRHYGKYDRQRDALHRIIQVFGLG